MNKKYSDILNFDLSHHPGALILGSETVECKPTMNVTNYPNLDIMTS